LKPADGNEFNKNGEISNKKRDAGTESASDRDVYVTTKGEVLWVPGGASPGDRVWTPKSYDEDLEFDIDYIVGPGTGTMV
jgi:hypothetical protein